MRDFDLEQQLIDARRRRFGEQAQAQAPQGRMVGGRFVAPHALEYLAAGLRGFGGIRGQQMAEDELRQLQTTRQQAVADALRGFNENMQGTPEQVIPNLTPVDDEGNPMPQAIKPAQPQNIPAALRALSTSPDAAMRQFAQQGAMQFAQKAAEKRQAEQDRQRLMGILQNSTPQQAIAAGVPVDLVKSYYEAPNIGRAEVARTVEITGANGEKLIQQLDKAGQPVGAPMPAYNAPMQINTGGAIELVAPKAGQRFAVGMSPSERDASARGWANVRQGQERLEIDKTKTTPTSKPLPTSALKMQQEALDAIGVVGSVNADLSALEKQIESKKLGFGPISNVVNVGRNIAGVSSEESRNFATFKSNMERLRNESLRLNTGVQTDGDAQRAWNELFQNITDTKLVKQRLQEIQRINKRGAELQRLKIDQIRGNYSLEPLDVMPQLNQPPALQGGANSRPDQATPPNELFNAADAILNKGKK
jgi:hypothetical protein